MYYDIEHVFPYLRGFCPEGILRGFCLRGLCPEGIMLNHRQLQQVQNIRSAQCHFPFVDSKPGVWLKQFRDFHGLGQGSHETNLFLHLITDGRLH